MQPEEAVKQIQCVTDASLDQEGVRVAPMYRPTFRRVAAEGTGADVSRLADLLTGEIQAGNRPAPEKIDTLAASILRRRRALTDGGRT
ncbi:hypothetical protein halTADL_3202 [Halohasta litchfieldiae]|jgi:hypothetical protein|uniref:Uncharacterized protein n=1 Tax=Halohasta litchfieldiae TaxID=1073996 RepID=A0A1H6SSG0_9EURY|nr:hypothetical protein [Halohasta litchfieldiae]ATW89904.1 hypothetical protein halTADL_3202 [Halohasta litchfieldiae]SEI66980.1 hypothetical protein SAMN05444271_10585 [Halohasta litchfieldiae]